MGTKELNIEINSENELETLTNVLETYRSVRTNYSDKIVSGKRHSQIIAWFMLNGFSNDSKEKCAEQLGYTLNGVRVLVSELLKNGYFQYKEKKHKYTSDIVMCDDFERIKECFNNENKVTLNVVFNSKKGIGQTQKQEE